MKDHDLENLVRSLRPAPLPGDLRTRLSAEPLRLKKPGNHRRVLVSLAMAAAAIMLMVAIILLLRPDRPDRPAKLVSSPEEPGRPVSVIKKDSTLLSSRVLSIEEYDGELWEISEEEWRDDTLALYSGGPSQLNSTAIRRDVVCTPLKFQ